MNTESLARHSELAERAQQLGWEDFAPCPVRGLLSGSR
jgi:hypothetical protein